MIDTKQILESAAVNGPQWSHECEDLDITLLYWNEGDAIPEHVNHEVDVVVIGLSGVGVVTVAGESSLMGPGSLVVIPKGIKRAFTAGAGGFGQLNIHKRRKRLQVQLQVPAEQRKRRSSGK
ncbi:MAG TPA: cupin domain-containing protein [Fimbriimonas sp.]|nr:cupin domain-containing protein [Fimbriimonas sp.]